MVGISTEFSGLSFAPSLGSLAPTSCSTTNSGLAASVPYQALKYLNKGSNHTNATFKAIPMGVCRRLVNLTSVNADREQDNRCALPRALQRLRRANLISVKDTFPTLRKASDDLKAHIEERNSEEKFSYFASLRWIILCFSLFTCTPIINFLEMCAHRRERFSATRELGLLLLPTQIRQRSRD
jgi:hypothetical protein